MGKNSTIINMLPVGGAKKVFSKLLWGFVYSVLYIGLITFAAFRGTRVTITVFGFLSIILFYLNCYTAMTTAKHCGKWYYIFGLMILLNALTFLIGSAVIFSVIFLYGSLAATVVFIVFYVILFFISGYYIENR
ncbi:MAG: hypothetical protein LUD77_01400 [Clostridiales bacterium]|nr:hypothetical protein [Clostridiales bacterium]